MVALPRPKLFRKKRKRKETPPTAIGRFCSNLITFFTSFATTKSSTSDDTGPRPDATSPKEQLFAFMKRRCKVAPTTENAVEIALIDSHNENEDHGEAECSGLNQNDIGSGKWLIFLYRYMYRKTHTKFLT
eukprot:TCONS_00019304-protein